MIMIIGSLIGRRSNDNIFKVSVESNTVASECLDIENSEVSAGLE